MKVNPRHSYEFHKKDPRSLHTKEPGKRSVRKEEDLSKKRSQSSNNPTPTSINNKFKSLSERVIGRIKSDVIESDKTSAFEKEHAEDLIRRLRTKKTKNIPNILNQKDSDGNTLLISMLAGGANRLVKILASTSLDVNAKDSYGWTALIHAINQDDPDPALIKKLINTPGINLNAKDDYGWTALMHAINKDNPNVDIIEILVNAPGIALNTKDNNGWTALMRAINKDNPNLDIIKLLIQAPKPYLNTKDNNGWTALMRAINKNNLNLDIIKILIQAPKPYLNTKDNNGRTALMRAIDKDNPNLDIIKLLIQAPKPYLNAKDNNGWTALMYATSKDNPNLDIIEILVNAPNIHLNTHPHTGWTPLVRAKLQDRKNVVEMLENKMSSNSRNKEALNFKALMMLLRFGIDPDEPETQKSIERLGVQLGIPNKSFSLDAQIQESFIRMTEETLLLLKIEDAFQEEDLLILKAKDVQEFSRYLKNAPHGLACLSPEECVKKAQNQEVFYLGVEFPEHYASVTFWGNEYCSINNKGEQYEENASDFSGIKIVKVPEGFSLDKNFFEKLSKGDISTYSTLFSWDPVLDIPQQSQKSGNCGMTNRRSAILASLTLFKVKQLKKSTELPEADAFDQAQKWARKVFNLWRLEDRLMVYEDYKSTEGADEELLNIAKTKFDNIVESTLFEMI